MVSSLKDQAIREDTLAFGEIGLAGELRSVSHADTRIAEAGRLGFRRVILPYHNLKNLSTVNGVEIIGVKTIREAFEHAV